MASARNGARKAGAIPSVESEGEAAIDRDAGAGRVTGIVAGDAGDQTGNLLRLPAETARVLAHARIRLTARAWRIAPIAARPAAIAFTFLRDCAIDFAGTGLAESKGRWMLAEALSSKADRISRVENLLDGFEC